MKKFFADFKKFIARGNIFDMAIGVIIGSAFSAIVTALTNKIIMPFINLLLSIGGENGLDSARTILKPAYVDNIIANGIDWERTIYIDWGSFITAIINFLLIALVLFIVLKMVMKASAMFREVVAETTNKELINEKKQVRKQAKEQNRKFKEVWKEHEEAKAKALAEAKALEEANKPKVETQEDILKDIRELLKKDCEQKENK